MYYYNDHGWEGITLFSGLHDRFYYNKKGKWVYKSYLDEQ